MNYSSAYFTHTTTMNYYAEYAGFQSGLHSTQEAAIEELSSKLMSEGIRFDEADFEINQETL